MEELMQILTVLGTMGGFAALLAMVINVGKSIGWVKDGQASNISLVGNMLAMIGLFVAQTYFPDLNVTEVDTALGMVATIGADILILVGQLKVSVFTHNTAKNAGISVVGKSYSAEKMLG